MCEETNQNPGGSPGETRSSDIQGKEASVKIKGPQTAEDKPKKAAEKPRSEL